MNILFEIADRDVVFIALAFIGLVIFGFVIFFVVTKNKVKPISEDERYDKEEFFPEIKPVTKEQQEAKDELERVFNQMAADLEKKEAEKDNIEEFERMQEENAIISYQELIKQANENKKNEEVKEVKSIEPKKETYKELKFEEKVEEPKENIKSPMQLELEIDDIEEPKKFKNSEIISPIFGIKGSESYEKSTAEVNISLARHAYEDKEPYEEENNAEFLNSLKEFRSNL